jgi:hypothetical protein
MPKSSTKRRQLHPGLLQTCDDKTTLQYIKGETHTSFDACDDAQHLFLIYNPTAMQAMMRLSDQQPAWRLSLALQAAGQGQAHFVLR